MGVENLDHKFMKEALGKLGKDIEDAMAHVNKGNLYSLLYLPAFILVDRWKTNREMSQETDPEKKAELNALMVLQDNKLYASVINAIPFQELKEKYGWCAHRAFDKTKDIKQDSKIRMFERLFQDFLKGKILKEVSGVNRKKFMMIRKELGAREQSMCMYYYMRSAYPSLFWNIISDSDDMNYPEVSFPVAGHDSNTKTSADVLSQPFTICKAWHLLEYLDGLANPQFIASIKESETITTPFIAAIRRLNYFGTRFTGVTKDAVKNSLKDKEHVYFYSPGDNKQEARLHPRLEWILRF